VRKGSRAVVETGSRGGEMGTLKYWKVNGGVTRVIAQVESGGGGAKDIVVHSGTIGSTFKAPACIQGGELLFIRGTVDQ